MLMEVSFIEPIYTIGYTAFETLAEFLSVLQKYGITDLLDVRTTPYSIYHNAYNQPVLENVLPDINITYRFFGSAFGARQPFITNSIIDFEKIAASVNFRNGYEQVVEMMQRGMRVCMMCAEKAPECCHRAIMVARVFHENGIPVEHILSEETTITHAELEDKLLEKYGLDDTQLSLFESRSREERLQEAYRAANREIGWKTA